MDNLGVKKKYKLKGKVIACIFCVICLVLGIVIGIYIPKGITKDEVIDSSVVNEIIEIIENNWVDTTESEDDIYTRMVNGLINNLGDPYTSYMTLEQTSDFNDSINGNFVGIGIQFSAIDDGGLVMKVFQDTPADKAGIKAGDIITEVNGTSTAGKSSDDIKNLVIGEANTAVKLTISRANKIMNMTATRASVETDVQYYVNGDYGFLSLNTFGESTASHVEEALKYFKNNNADYIVIDVRGNGGGYLESVRDILSLFIPNNQIIFKLQYKNNETTEYKSNSKNKYSFEQGYILMDGDSASCSEVLIGGLTEILGYKTIGTTSFGKGIAQTQTSLSNGSTLKYTHAKWLTPSGVCIHNKGFEPDYKVDKDDITQYGYTKFDGSYKYDSVSDNVKLMQKMLKKLGYDVDREDGYFSKGTESALKQYQKDIGVNTDGVYTFTMTKKLYSSVAVEIYQNSEDKDIKKAEELMK